jgi:hypothetical protein
LHIAAPPLSVIAVGVGHVARATSVARLNSGPLSRADCFS